MDATNATHEPCRLHGVHWWSLVALGIVEVGVSGVLVRLNPVAGWDENVYLMSARHLVGGAPVPYAHHRPPLFPLLIALFGAHYRMLPALAHIGCVVVFFLILRRLVTPWMAIGGVAVLMLSGDLRYFGMLLMTEVVSVFLLLTLTLLFTKRMWRGVGAVGALLVLTHWQMTVIVPAVLGVCAVGRRWRDCASVGTGVLVVLLPFLVVSAAVYGNPLYPLVANFTTNTVGHGLSLPQPVANDLTYYWRELPATHLPLVAGGVAALCWLVASKVRGAAGRRWDLIALLIAMAGAQLVPMHAIIPKDMRLLVPLVPLLLLSSILLLHFWGERAGRLRWTAWPVLVVSVLAVMPDRNLLWEINDRINDPVNGLCALEATIAEVDPEEPIYTDISDLAVMGHTGRRTVAITGEASRHFTLYDRACGVRSEIPPWALYITWNPGDGTVLASGRGRSGDRLYLVRWPGEAVAAYR